MVTAEITAKNYFGARHGLETLFQAMEYDDLPGGGFLMLADLTISDGPAYRHRGVMVDTARCFIEEDVLKGIIDGMASSKLNVFHWHFADSQSFPVELSTAPVDQMLQYGAYGRNSVYSVDTVKSLVDYAAYRGF